MYHEIFFFQYYQALFRDGECFLHVVSLLNGNLDKAGGEKLVLNVFRTLTCLLASNDASKVSSFSLCFSTFYFSKMVNSILPIVNIYIDCVKLNQLVLKCLTRVGSNDGLSMDFFFPGV